MTALSSNRASVAERGLAVGHASVLLRDGESSSLSPALRLVRDAARSTQELLELVPSRHIRYVVHSGSSKRKATLPVRTRCNFEACQYENQFTGMEGDLHSYSALLKDLAAAVCCFNDFCSVVSANLICICTSSPWLLMVKLLKVWMTSSQASRLSKLSSSQRMSA